jgi:lambda family phage portal protein
MARFPALASRGFVLPARLAAHGTPYESGGTSGSRVRDWRPTSGGPNTVGASNLNTIRNRSRDAIRNDPWAKSASDTWVSEAIGTGFQPHPQHPDPEVRKAQKRLWNLWAPYADADGMLDIYGLQGLAGRAIFGDGETLARIRPRRASDGLPVPVQIQCMEADHLPVEKNELLPNGSEIVNGVEFNAIGQRAAYWPWKRHPGDIRGMNVYNENVRVPADQVIHAFDVLRPGQVRGVPVLATVLLRLKSLDNFDDAVLFRQEVANLFAGFIKKPNPEGNDIDPVTGGTITKDSDGFTPLVTMEPGTMQELLPGEDVQFSNPPDAGGNYTPFLRQQLMAVAAGVSIPYEFLTGDLRDVSDRTLRVIVNGFRRRLEQWQFNTFVHQWCRPVWDAFMDAAVLSGAFPVRDYYRNRWDYLAVNWVGQGWAYMHPVQDVQSKGLQMQYGLKPRSAHILEMGEDPQETDEQFAADKARAEALGLVFEFDQVVPADAAQQNEMVNAA